MSVSLTLESASAASGAECGEAPVPRDLALLPVHHQAGECAGPVQGPGLAPHGAHLHQRARVRGAGQHPPGPGPRHSAPPIRGRRGGRGHPVRHLLPHGAGQDAAAAAGRGCGARLQGLAGLPGADLPARGPARRAPRAAVHAAARDAQLRRLLPHLRRADARAGLRARRPAAGAQAAAGGRHVGHRVLAVHLPRGRGQVAAAGGRAARRPALPRHPGLRAPELPRRGLARLHAGPGLHAAACLPGQRRHLRHRHRGALVRAGPGGRDRGRGCARRPRGARPGPALQPVTPARPPPPHCHFSETRRGRPSAPQPVARLRCMAADSIRPAFSSAHQLGDLGHELHSRGLSILGYGRGTDPHAHSVPSRRSQVMPVQRLRRRSAPGLFGGIFWKPSQTLQSHPLPGILATTVVRLPCRLAPRGLW
ncbi:mitochondrial basic amino acids transporter isoform X2 [Cynocephalus volans]|uniref:mitochondrial basic amino acids transporter isoform X2 n=1 Tax=Cynocephalus volans TaxID=110931 RepID=UPI002FC73B9B